MLIGAPIVLAAGVRANPFVMLLAGALWAVPRTVAVGRGCPALRKLIRVIDTKRWRSVPSLKRNGSEAAPSGFRGDIRTDARATVCAMSSPATPATNAVLISAHAVEQYRERVKPGLDLDTARGELERLRPVGEISADAPSWVNAAKPAPYYMLLGDAIVLPLAPDRDGWVATTCVTHRTLTATRRVAKSARKASLGARKRATRRARF